MNMESFQKAIEVCRTLIGIKNPVTDEDIDNAVNNVVLMFSESWQRSPQNQTNVYI